MVRGGLARRATAVALALIADRAFGEPPAAVHPVARFGQLMEAAEGRWWADRRRTGAVFAVAGVGLAATVGLVATRAGRSGRVGGLAAATYVAVAGRALCDAADQVADALRDGDLDAARTRVRDLVGRETAQLDEGEVVRATVESVAENTVDAVIAPLVWAALAGAPGVLAHRASNTLDAMVGHRSPRYERFGWASARADDVANWLPARVTAGAVAAVRPARAVAVLQAVRSQASAHPSPNAGVSEAAFAAALGVTLGGTNRYGGRTEIRPRLGSGPAPGVDHIAAACRLSRHATYAVAGTLGLVAATGWRS
jgi:adenosylcobinamide-phosphate synthase